jgi:hypothetical protein
MEYPKSLYRGSVEDHVIVRTPEEEELKRKDGYEMYAEIHARTLNPEEVKEAPKRGRPKAS